MHVGSDALAERKRREKEGVWEGDYGLG
jgi:hypothetical protein